MRTLRPDLHLSLSPNLRLSLAVFFSICSKFHSVIERAFIHSCWLPPLGLLGPPLPHASRQHSQLMITLSLPLSLQSCAKNETNMEKTEKTKSKEKWRMVRGGKTPRASRKATNKQKSNPIIMVFLSFFCLTDPHRSSPDPLRPNPNINHNFRCPLGEREIIFIRRFYGTNPRSEKVSIANLTASSHR